MTDILVERVRVIEKLIHIPRLGHVPIRQLRIPLVWTDLFNGGDCGEPPREGVKVLFALDMDTEGCASGRLDLLYGLISSMVVIAGNRPEKV